MSAGHVAPKSMYYMVFLALLVGTGLTVAAAFVDMGPMNNVVMLTIALVKATLVVLFFMHVRWGTRLTWVVAMAGFFWLLILFGVTMGDYMTRGWIQGTLRCPSRQARLERRAHLARLLSFWPAPPRFADVHPPLTGPG